MDHGVIKPGVFIINDFDRETLEWMDQSGIKYDVLIDDVKAYYRGRTEMEELLRGGRSTCFQTEEDSVAVPSNFVTGSMGGFYTYEEFLQQLDSMHTLFPDLIAARDSIDTFLTHECRPIYFTRITDNINQNEAEPDVLYPSVHHAREPQSLTQLIYYMWYLFENYGVDDDITALVDQTEMYFVPMLNPDGYNINQTNDPNGGGLWRKNARDNGDGTMGVDLNRNYGYEWGYDNSGSSPNTSSQTYRGPAGFSEPETQAIKWFCEQHEFGLALNYHSYGNYIIYPWGFNDQLTPDSNNFRMITEEMTRYNDYVAGTGMETVGYPVNGDSDDWMYGEQTTKNKILSMTPEVGTQGDGFWPAQSRILPLSQENVHPNLMLAHLVGDYASIADASSMLIESTTDSIHAEAVRLGLQFNGPYSFSVEPVSANIQSVSTAASLSSMDQGEVVDLGWEITLDGSISAGDEVVYDLVSSFNGFESRVRVTKIFGQATVLLTNDGDLGDFLSETDWGLTTEAFVTPSHSITDSPNAQYFNNVENDLVYNRIIDLRNADEGILRFAAQWEIEAGWDFAQVKARVIGETQWVPLCAKYSVEGNVYQDPGQPLWDGFQTSWVDEEVFLTDFLGERIEVKFTLESDQFVTFDGFYIDDLEVVALLPDGLTEFPDTGYVDTIGTTPPDTTGGVGIGDKSAEHWSVFPNPTEGRLYVNAAKGSALQVQVMTLTGAVVQEDRIRGSYVELGDLETGLYLIRLTDPLSKRSEIHRVTVMR